MIFYSPGISEGKFYLFYAEDLIKTYQHLDEDEFVEVERVNLSDVSITMLSDGKSIMAVEYAKKRKGIV